MQLPERTTEGRLVAGVCAGLAAQWEVDVTLLRLAFLLGALAWGLGLPLYATLWALMPPPGCGRSSTPLLRTARDNLARLRRDLGRSGGLLATDWRGARSKPWLLPLDRRGVAVALIATGALIFLASIGAFSWLTGGRALGLAVIGVGAALLVTLRR